MSWVLTIAYFALFLWVIKRWSFFKNSGISTKFLWGVFAAKVIASFLLFYVYTAHYQDRAQADIFKYFDDSKILFEALPDKPGDYFRMLSGVGIDNQYFFDNYYIHMNNWDRAYDSNVYNDSHTIIRINAVLHLFSFGSFHVHSLFFCLFSLVGMVGFYRALIRYFEKIKTVFLLFLFLTPSVFLWTSGVLKESILIFALGLLLFSIDTILQKRKQTKSILLIALCLLLLVYIKFYVLIAFIPAMLCYLSAHFIKTKKWVIYSLLLSFFTLFAMNAKYIPPHVDLVKILERKQRDFKRLAEWQNAGSEFGLTDIEPSFLGIAKVVPEGVLNCFVRPLPWNAKGWLYYPAVLENLWILLLLGGVGIATFRKELFVKEDAKNSLWFTFVFVLLLFAIIGVTTPVAGALVRYKVPALPLLSFGLLYLLQNSKNLNFIERKLPRSK